MGGGGVLATPACYCISTISLRGWGGGGGGGGGSGDSRVTVSAPYLSEESVRVFLHDGNTASKALHVHRTRQFARLRTSWSERALEGSAKCSTKVLYLNAVDL